MSQVVRSTLSLALLSLALGTAAVAASSPAVQDVAVSAELEETRRAALLQLVDEIQRVHPKPFFGVSEDDFFGAVDSFHDGLEYLTGDQFIVEVMRLVALVGSAGQDGHTGVWPFGAFRLMPVQLYWFADGLFVVKASPEHKALEGAQVLSIGGNSPKQLLAAVNPLIARDNDWNARVKFGIYTLMPELLHALGLTSGRDGASFRFKLASGEEVEQKLAGKGVGDYMSWNVFPPFDLPSSPDVMYLSKPRENFWMRVLDDKQTLYVQYNQVNRTTASGQSMTEFAAEIASTFHASKLSRMVIDLRRNGGGDNTAYAPLIQLFSKDKQINQQGKLFLLTGRATFSAAGNFLTEMERSTEALIAGEPAGASPNQWGDAQRIQLKGVKGVDVFLSSRWWQKSSADDMRLETKPDLPLVLTSAQYFAGQDPLLELVQAHGE